MENEEAAKPVVTIARYQDRIPTDKSPAKAAGIHGASAVFVDGKCYADILAAEAKAAEPQVGEQTLVQPTIEAPAAEAPPGDERRVADDPAAEQYVGERAGDHLAE